MVKKGIGFIINDLFTEFEFDKFSNQDKIDDSLKLEYIKEMIVFARNDKQAVFMYFGFAIATVVFLIDKLDTFIRKSGFDYLMTFYIGISLLMISSILFFTYWRKIHKCHMSLVSCIPHLNIEMTRDLWVKLWKDNRHYFKFGFYFLTSGLLIIFITILVAKLKY